MQKIEEKINMILFIYYNFDDNDVDLISVIIKYMKFIYKKELINTIIQFENFNISATKNILIKKK